MACSLRPCSLKAAGLHPFQSCSWPQPATVGPRTVVAPRASPEPGPGPSAPPSNAEPSAAAVEAKERQVERLEAAIKGKASSSAAKQPGNAKPIPIRGMTQTQRKVDSQYENMAEWKEGKLFPEGWDNMNLFQKAAELYLGRRGFIFWLNKAAFASVFVLLGGWVLFRFVGPNLGLYSLQGELVPPPL